MRTAAILLFIGCCVALVYGVIVTAKRWTQKRKRPPEPRLVSVDFLRSIEIDAPPGSVWDLCYLPENSVLTVSDCLAGSTVPGTPRGQVGEQQSFTYATSGETHSDVIEVVHLIPGREATTVSLMEPMRGLGSRTTTSVSSTEGGRTLLTLTQAYAIADESLETLPDEFYDTTLTWMDDYLRQVKEHAETGGSDRR